MYRNHILVCGGTGCTSNNSMKIADRFKELLTEKGLDKEVQVIRTGCFGLCAVGPVIIIYPEGAFYSRVEVSDVDEIVSEHIEKGRIVNRLLHTESNGEKVMALTDTNFYKKQARVALRNCGVIDPENIDEYIAHDGYQALIKVLTSMSRQDVIDTMLKSGLRGRGGAGFPTGRKWSFAMAQPAKTNMFVVTPTKVTRARLWIDRY